jgi:hypothetical protein
MASEALPSRSMSCSCAMERISSPSFASTVFKSSPLASLKWILMLPRGRVRTAGPGRQRKTRKGRTQCPAQAAQSSHAERLRINIIPCRCRTRSREIAHPQRRKTRRGVAAAATPRSVTRTKASATTAASRVGAWSVLKVRERVVKTANGRRREHWRKRRTWWARSRSDQDPE